MLVLLVSDHGPTMCLHALPHLARPTVNELPPRQYEKASFVRVRAQSPPELELVPCALSALDKRGRKKWRIMMTTHKQGISKQGTLPSYASPYEDFFFRRKTKRKKNARFTIIARAPVLPRSSTSFASIYLHRFSATIHEKILVDIFFVFFPQQYKRRHPTHLQPCVT